MKLINAYWIDINEACPPFDSEHRIVRCITKDHNPPHEPDTFYFMAMYMGNEDWIFFDGSQEGNQEYEKYMQVTHWTNEPIIEKDHQYTRKDDNDNTSA